MTNSSSSASHAGYANAFRACPLIAILRGVTADTAVAHAEVLYEAGFRVVEVPLNSPEPFDSIEAMTKALPADAIIGAGTVLKLADVDTVKAAGGELIVMPHCDTEIIAAAKEKLMASVPGVATPTEAFQALKFGADALKMFPFEQLGAKAIKAWRAVLGTSIWLIPVGGISPAEVRPLTSAGASGFGLGTALYKPGQDAAMTKANALAFIAALRELPSQQD
jgi:2-dehydro-3-deoxyphosphogalactonate aldolase